MREKERLRNSSRLQEIILGNQWLKLTWVAWQQEVPIWRKVLPPKTNEENSGRVQRRWRSQSICPTNLPKSLLESILTERLHAPSGRMLSQTKYGHKQNDCPEATQKLCITIKPEIVIHEAEQLFWVPVPPCCSLSRQPFPIKCFFFYLSVLSPRTIHFCVRQEPTVQTCKRSPFLQQLEGRTTGCEGLSGVRSL